MSALKDIVFVPARATLTEVEMPEALRERLRVALASADEKLTGEALAALGPVGENGQPRMMQVSAWICHAGLTNRKGYRFTEEGLRAAVQAGLFKAPYVGMVDYNHDFSAIGAWYDAEFKLDPATGTMGILAHGTIWSWRYEGQANTLLAMQQRFGKVEVSVGCLFKNGTIDYDENGLEAITIHDPVFLTTSVLDVDPADPYARGLATESVTNTAEERAIELLRASLDLPPANTEEDHMKELLDALTAKLGEQAATFSQELAPLVEAASRLASVEQELATAQASVATLTDKVTELTTANAGLETKVGESETLLAAARAELERVQAEHTELAAFKAGIEQAEADKVRAEREAARKAEIPEGVMQALEASDKKDAILTDWLNLPDDQWEIRKASFVVASAPKQTRQERTAVEGLLSATADTNETNGGFAIDRLRK